MKQIDFEAKIREKKDKKVKGTFVSFSDDECYLVLDEFVEEGTLEITDFNVRRED